MHYIDSSGGEKNSIQLSKQHLNENSTAELAPLRKERLCRVVETESEYWGVLNQKIEVNF